MVWRRLAEYRDVLCRSRGVLRRGGVQGLVPRAARSAYIRSGAQSLEFPVRQDDIASSSAIPAVANRGQARAPLRIGWVMVPPSIGSGGHTTAFRAVEALERFGHECVLFLYDRFDGDLASRAYLIRRGWPAVSAEVRNIGDGVRGVDALVATSWATAHVVAHHADQVARCFYFVQDYEPYFYPRGAEYLLAEDTYRFGFHGITAGPWLAEKLARDHAMKCDAFEFGADTAVYRYDPERERRGVAFYVKPNVPRRGYHVGVAALREFSRRWPDAPIHLYGDPVHAQKLPLDAISHGRIPPARISDIYNTCRTGLSLSFTNVSLVPWEMLACGVVPVVNDAEHNRAVLQASGVAWASPSVGALADAMSQAYESYSNARGRSLVDGVVAMSWDDAMNVVVRAIERGCGLP